MTSDSTAIRLWPGSPDGDGAPAIAFGAYGPLSSPKANIDGWRRNGRSKRQA